MSFYRLTIKGRVQGVFYRSFVNQLAKRLKLCGYVKNLLNGNVEVGVECEDKHLLNLFICELKRGNTYSIVKKICFEKVKDKKEKFENFRIFFS